MRELKFFGMFLVLLLLKPIAAGAAVKGIDCQRTEGDIEVLICSDARLLALEREVTRLYALAENGYRAKVREGELAATQQDWVMARDTCWKTPDPIVCIIDQSMGRIREIRTDFYDSTQDDAKGISSGPVRWACAGLTAPLVAVQARTEPALMQITWKGEFATLTQVNASRDYKDGGYVFSPTGGEAKFQMPDKLPMTCKVEPAD
jgi:uncharacterized protein